MKKQSNLIINGDGFTVINMSAVGENLRVGMNVNVVSGFAVRQASSYHGVIAVADSEKREMGESIPKGEFIRVIFPQRGHEMYLWTGPVSIDRGDNLDAGPDGVFLARNDGSAVAVAIYGKDAMENMVHAIIVR